jgi:hypothetical protein
MLPRPFCVLDGQDPGVRAAGGDRNEWNIDAVPEMPRGECAIFRYEPSSEGDWTHMLVTYRRAGLHAFLDRLEAQLDARVLQSTLS